MGQSIDKFTELYSAEQLPVFVNQFYNSPEEAISCTKGDVILVQDLQTGLVYNKAFQAELMQYGTSYMDKLLIPSLSPRYRNNLQEVSLIVKEHFNGCTLLEVGCGKGYFLEYLQELGFDIFGLDPTYEGENPKVFKEYFSPELGLRGDAIILRHVIEHIQRPVDFLASLRESNGGAGRIYIEVPCFDWICQHRAWFDIYYEHVNYFRIGDFNRMFGTIYESGHIFSGQYLYVVADLETLRKPNYDGLDGFHFPKGLLATVDRYSKRLTARRLAHRSSAIWCAAMKGVMFALFMQREGAEVDFVIDINPATHGKYLPATGLRVHPPEVALSQLEPGADIFVMNSNYLDEIKELTNNSFNLLPVDIECKLGIP